MADEPKLLLVDDEPKNLVALTALLDDLGADLVCARSGEDALRSVLRERFAAIIMDVRMPGMDGFETAEAIRTLPRAKETPIIFVSAHADRRAEARGATGDTFLLKPLEPDVIRREVRRHIEH